MNSILLVDKNSGPTSFDVVRSVRRRFGKLPVGHAGTLDPFATGLMVVMTGRATKLASAFLHDDKGYEAEVRLGTATDSFDRTGQVTETRAVPALTVDDVEAALAKFRGTWMQTPPMFSAKKQQGVRLYELARKQITVPREPAPVEIRSLDLKSFDGERIQFALQCSKGTYVRSLAVAIGEALGTVAHLSELRRTISGGFRVEDSSTLDGLAGDWDARVEDGRRRYESFCSQPVASQKLGKPSTAM